MPEPTPLLDTETPSSCPPTWLLHVPQPTTFLGPTGLLPYVHDTEASKPFAQSLSVRALSSQRYRLSFERVTSKGTVCGEPSQTQGCLLRPIPGSCQQRLHCFPWPPDAPKRTGHKAFFPQLHSYRPTSCYREQQRPLLHERLC